MTQRSISYKYHFFWSNRLQEETLGCDGNARSRICPREWLYFVVVHRVGCDKPATAAVVHVSSKPNRASCVLHHAADTVTRQSEHSDSLVCKSNSHKSLKLLWTLFIPLFLSLLHCVPRKVRVHAHYCCFVDRESTHIRTSLPSLCQQEEGQERFCT